MKETDSMLLGTQWTRDKGEHSPVTGTIDQCNNRGPRLKLGDGSHRRLAWAELDFGWKPTDKRSENRYFLWKHATTIEYLDQKDAELKEVLGSLQTAIESETIMPSTEVNGGAVEIEQTKECHGPWHRHGDSYDQVPLSQFSTVTKGFNAGQLYALCDSCRQRQKDSDAKRKAATKEYLDARDKRWTEGSFPEMERKKPGPKPGTKRPPKAQPVPEPIQIVPGVETLGATVYRWKITVTVSQEHLVQGKDFLEACAQVAELGEITKFEKL